MLYLVFQDDNQRPSQATAVFPFEALAKQGVNIQEISIPRDMLIPTTSSSLSTPGGKPEVYSYFIPNSGKCLLGGGNFWGTF